MNEQKVSTNADVINALHHMFRHFCTHLKLELPEPVFSLIPNRSSRAGYLGWFAQGSWKDQNVNTEQDPNGTHVRSEINIAADKLDRPLMDIAETVLHEMAHYKNNVDNVSDCNRNQYHNMKFKKTAETMGMDVTKMGRYGYAHTVLNEEAKVWVQKYISEHLEGKNPFVLSRVGPRQKTTTAWRERHKTVLVKKEIFEALEENGVSSVKNLVEDLLLEYLEK
jgi:hypothetical protein